MAYMADDTQESDQLDPPRHTLELPSTLGDDREYEGGDLLGDDEERDPGDRDTNFLYDELKALREELRNKDAEHQRTVSQLISQRHPEPTGQQMQNMANSADFSLEDLPDAVEKPKEFKDALQRKMSEFMQNQTQQMSQQQQRQAAIQQMETGFATKYQDLADKKALMRAAVTEEANTLRTQGIDSENFILNNQNDFLERVANRMRSELGDAGSDDGEGQSSSKQRSAKRTQGVSGGSTPSTSAGKKGGKAKAPPSFSQQMKQVQQEMGLI